jgi:C4-dicarboxylate-specific signal transduction histidine kinase
MEAEKRKTGISVVGDRPWGAHLCLFYETKEDLLEIVAPYLKAGFESGEYCVWGIPDILTQQEAQEVLKELLSEFGEVSDERSFEIHSGRDLYLTGGRFDREKVKATWNAKLAHALAAGYEGLRVVGDAFWLDESAWRDFYEYEMELNQSMAGRPMSVLCAYPLTVTGAADVFDVARVHQCAMAKRNRDWEVIETPALKQAKEEIARLNAELEQRVIERTAQLTAANEELRAVIAERTRAQSALQEAQADLARAARVTAMGEMAAAIAHEINQPLAAIITESESCLRWLAQSPPNLGEVQEAVNCIISDASRASDVIKRIRMLLNKEAPAQLSLNIDETIREVLALMRGLLEIHHVSLTAELSAGDRPVIGDRVLLQQVVQNLIINAVEAMIPVTDRPRELLVRTRHDGSSDVRVAVQDTGIGLDPKDGDRVFDAFFTSKRDGMGMGLSICRSIIDAHGGHIWASAASPHGALFQFTLPAEIASADDR